MSNNFYENALVEQLAIALLVALGWETANLAKMVWSFVKTPWQIYLLWYIRSSSGAHMHYHYIVGFYVDKDGKMPVSDYLMDGKNQKDLSTLINIIQSLALIGQEIVDDKRAKKLKGENSLYELRKGSHRIFYTPDGIKFVLLSAFTKTTDQTPDKQLKLARSYQEDYRKHHRFFELKLPTLSR